MNTDKATQAGCALHCRNFSCERSPGLTTELLNLIVLQATKRT